MPDSKSHKADDQVRLFTEQEVKAVIDSLQTVEPSFKLLSREQAAEFIRNMGKKTCTAKSLANLASDGKGPRFIPLGNETFYLPRDIEEWILSRRIDPRRR